MERPGGKYGPPSKTEAVNVKGEGGQRGVTEDEDRHFVREDLVKASQVLATAFEVRLIFSMSYCQFTEIVMIVVIISITFMTLITKIIIAIIITCIMT